MNPADPKWLEILKASGWQTTSLTLACIVILILIKNEIIPTTGSPLWIALPAIGGVIFGFLSLGAIASALVEFFKPERLYATWRAKCQKIKEVRAFIPYMTEKDKEIIGYLLYHNQRMFQTDDDAGYAAPLLSKGIIQIAAKQGQSLDLKRVPFEIPDYIWSELERHRDEFPYKPPQKGKTEVYPWAIHWMVR